MPTVFKAKYSTKKLLPVLFKKPDNSRSFLQTLLSVGMFFLLFFIAQGAVFADQVSYTYDDAGRLTAMSYADGYKITQVAFNYDSTGNPTSKEVTEVIQDADGDGMPDGFETSNGFDPEDPSDAAQDADGDALSNLEEYEHSTDPLLEDTDGDGFSDSVEIFAGFDPLDPSDHPEATAVPAAGTFGIVMLILLLLAAGIRNSGRVNAGTAAAVLLALAMFFHGADAFAGAKGPGWYSGSGETVTPEQAAEYFTKIKTQAGTKQLLSKSGSAVEAIPEIIELARALQHDPKLIYEYVRNHVDYVPYFGSLKGAALTFFDGAGNDFDQASLMIALLRESGYQAQYVYGQLDIPYYGSPDNKDLQHWLSVSADPVLIQQVLYNGGIPNEYNGYYCRMNRVWVMYSILHSRFTKPHQA